VGFRGNQHIDRSELMQQVMVKPHRLLLSRGKFSDKLLRQSVRGLPPSTKIADTKKSKSSLT